MVSRKNCSVLLRVYGESLRPGDLVKTFTKNFGWFPGNRYGIIVRRKTDVCFEVLFSDGSVRGIWINEMEVVSESR